MPIYCYQCNDCGEKFEVKHSMNFNSQKCNFCKSESVFRIPSLPEIKARLSLNHKNKPGKIVNSYIADAKKEIKDEKNNLKPGS